MTLPLKVAFDANIWISVVLGGRMIQLESLVMLPTLHILTCIEGVNEFENSLLKPKLDKY